MSAGRQFTIHGFHYEAGQPYQWIGEANPLDDTPREAPLVSQKQRPRREDMHAAHEIEEQGDALTAQAVAGRGWELFDAGAWNGDAKYSFDKQAMQKARLLLRRLNDGRVELGGSTAAATPTYDDNGVRSTTGKRDKLRARFYAQISTAHRRHRGIRTVVALHLTVGAPRIGVPRLKCA